MFNKANHTSGNCVQYRFGAVQLHFDQDQVFRTSVTRGRCDKVDFDSIDTANESVVLPCAVAAAYGLAIQALRDVRHLLPADGVPIVDAVLDHVARLAERMDFAMIRESTADRASTAIRGV